MNFQHTQLSSGITPVAKVAMTYVLVHALGIIINLVLEESKTIKSFRKQVKGSQNQS